MILRSPKIRDWVCWTAVIVGFLLPSIFALGYSSFTIELWTTVGGAALCGLLLTCAAPTNTRWAGGVLALFVAAYVLVYYSPLAPTWVIGLIAFALSLPAVFFPRDAVVIVAVALTFSAVGTGFQRASFQVTSHDRSLTPSDIPSVIHIVLDEQTSEWGVPIFMPEKTIRSFSDFYVNRGFHVYQRGFSLDSRTPASFARLLNPYGDPNPSGQSLINTDLWDKISDGRILDLTESYLKFPRLTANPRLAHLKIYNFGIPYPFVERLPLPRRLLIGAVTMVKYFKGPNALNRLASGLNFLGADAGAAAIRRVVDFIEANSRMHSLMSAAFFDAWSDHLAREGRRGTYYFFHALLPHFPYVFTNNCELKPPASWHSIDWLRQSPRSYDQQRYQSYVDQVHCAQQHIARLLSAVETNPNLRDAVIVVQGDHGSRTAYQSRDLWVREGGTIGTWERHWRAALFAVKFPGASGQTFSEPVAIHDLLGQLVDANFMEFKPIARSYSDDPIHSR
jgi:hypothetical protein